MKKSLSVVPCLYNKFLNYTIFRLGQGKLMWFKMSTGLNHGVLCSIHMMIQRILKNEEYHWTYLPIYMYITQVEYVVFQICWVLFLVCIRKCLFVSFKVGSSKTDIFWCRLSFKRVHSTVDITPILEPSSYRQISPMH